MGEGICIYDNQNAKRFNQTNQYKENYRFSITFQIEVMIIKPALTIATETIIINVNGNVKN